MAINFSETSDEELVKLALQESSYYKVLIERYIRKLGAYVKRLSNSSKEDIEDILQEVFILAYKNLRGFNSAFKFSSWIYRITHNATISHFRKNKKNKGILDLEDNELGERISSGLNLEEKVDKEFLIDELLKALDKIDLRYKSVLILRFIDEKDYQEISDILKIPVGTVGTYIKRGKEGLLKLLKIHL